MTARIPFVEPWTPERVAARLRECATTLRIAPTSGHTPGQRMTYWPVVVIPYAERYPADPGQNNATRTQAASDQIDRMDRTLQLISRYLSVEACRRARIVEDAGLVLWGRANNWSYAKIGKLRKARYGGETRGGGPSLNIPGGNARPSLVRIERTALQYLATLMNRTTEQVDVEVRRARREGPDLTPPREAPPDKYGIRTIAPQRGPPQYDDLEDPDRPVHARTRGAR